MNAIPQKRTPAGGPGLKITDHWRGLQVRFYTVAASRWSAEAVITAIAAGFIVAHLMGATP